MKTKEALEGGALWTAAWNAICRQPIIIEPNVKEQNEHKAGEVKNVLFNWYAAHDDVARGTDEDVAVHAIAESGSRNAECRGGVRKFEKYVGKEEVKYKAKWKEKRDCT